MCLLWVMRQRAEAELPGKGLDGAPDMVVFLSLCEMVCLLAVEAYAMSLLCVIQQEMKLRSLPSWNLLVLRRN